MTPQKSLEDLAKSMKDMETSKLTNLIDGLHNELAIVSNNAVLEIIFKEYFLDFFFNIGKIEINQVLIYKWLELSGGPFREVDIIDNNGAYIMTVPALYERPNIDFDDMNKKDFSNIAANFNLKLNRFHADGINYLNMELQSVPASFSKPDITTIARWKAIFDYYYPPVKTGTVIDKLKKSTLDENMFNW
jgi:hypothetical protein